MNIVAIIVTDYITIVIISRNITYNNFTNISLKQ